MTRLKAVVAYDGAVFHGFAENRGVATVAGTLRSSLSRVLRHDVDLVGAGRTDAGVHAWGQVVSFDAEVDDLDALRRAINGICAPSLVIRHIDRVANDFDARFSAQWRRYRYTIVCGPVPNPFLTATAWYVPHELDVDALRLASDVFVGTHDFTSFCRGPKLDEGGAPPSLVRRIFEAHWSEIEEDVLRFEVRGQSFCHNQVRAIVGTLVDVGTGRRHAGDVLAILRARDRARASMVAPPHGLCLREVGY